MPGSNIEVGLETFLGEIAKLERVRAIGLPASLFTDAPEKCVLVALRAAIRRREIWVEGAS